MGTSTGMGMSMGMRRGCRRGAAATGCDRRARDLTHDSVNTRRCRRGAAAASRRRLSHRQ
eukprot:scaffold39485_cov36-Phaeocystis_antarctica.AAC.2